MQSRYKWLVCQIGTYFVGLVVPPSLVQLKIQTLYFFHREQNKQLCIRDIILYCIQIVIVKIYFDCYINVTIVFINRWCSNVELKAELTKDII